MLETEAKDIASLLKVLSNEYRLRIFCVLMNEPFTVKEIAQKLPEISQSELSQHLRVLKNNNIIDSSKSGKYVTYCISNEHIAKLIYTIKKYY